MFTIELSDQKSQIMKIFQKLQIDQPIRNDHSKMIIFFQVNLSREFLR